MKFLDIGTLSEHSGLPASTLRYYDEIGLISAVGRRGLRRQFGPEAILRLRLVALGKRAGFSLAEIAAMFSADGKSTVPRAALVERAAEIERQIKELGVLRGMQAGTQPLHRGRGGPALQVHAQRGPAHGDQPPVPAVAEGEVERIALEAGAAVGPAASGAGPVDERHLGGRDPQAPSQQQAQPEMGDHVRVAVATPAESRGTPRLLVAAFHHPFRERAGLWTALEESIEHGGVDHQRNKPAPA